MSGHGDWRRGSGVVQERWGAVEVAFVANAQRPPARRRDAAAGALLLPPGVAVACCLQEHGARAVRAQPSTAPGSRPRADALYTDEPDLALCVVTADCVPVLIASEHAVCAVHAGWRGLAGGVIDNAVAALSPPGPSHGVRALWCAWIGPAIGACCYEVSWEVAARVARRCGGAIVQRGCRQPATGRPHLDLPAGARRQLERLGIERVHVLRRCTRCGDGDARGATGWASYRRDGETAGRNLALIWRGSRPQARS